jgi:hypothetical protein
LDFLNDFVLDFIDRTRERVFAAFLAALDRTTLTSCPLLLNLVPDGDRFLLTCPERLFLLVGIYYIQRKRKKEFK